MSEKGPSCGGWSGHTLDFPFRGSCSCLLDASHHSSSVSSWRDFLIITISHKCMFVWLWEQVWAFCSSLQLIWNHPHSNAWPVSNMASICLALGMIAIFSLSLSLCCFLTPAITQINRLSGSAFHSNFLIIFLCWFLAIKPLGLARAKQLPVAACFLSLIWGKLLPLGW